MGPTPVGELEYSDLRTLLHLFSPFLTGYTVAMVTFNVQKITMTCPLVIGHLFDTITLWSTEKDFWYRSVEIEVFKNAGNCSEPP